jgi:hypothetical protein
MRVEQMLIWQEKPRIRFVKKLTSTSLSPFLKRILKSKSAMTAVLGLLWALDGINLKRVGGRDIAVGASRNGVQAKVM